MVSGIEQLRGGPGPAGKGQPAKELGQEDFLKLMVAQLKNQDPSNPVDNAQFLGQIAQFSMVSGIDELKGSFSSVASQLYGSQAMQASTLVGKEVLAQTSQAALGAGEAQEGIVRVPENSYGARVHVMDAAGNAVGTVSLEGAEAGARRFRWDGLTDDGRALPAGTYSFHAEAGVDGQVEALPVQLFSQVESISVDRANRGINLHLDGNQIIGLSQVSEFK